ncbi:MAG: GAF domain-containing sensor histidine kinase [Ardenticatenales bacterium]|nr:GAF domain-containing sensor histidine kinase [Ardenticatenales bacterium]
MDGWTEQLAALYDVLSLTSDVVSDLTLVLHRALGRILAVTVTRNGAIHILNEAATQLELVTEIALPPTLVAQWRQIPADQPPFKAALASEHYITLDLSQEPALAGLTGLAGVQTLLSFPIRKGARNLGTLTAVLGRETVDEGEMRLFVSLADQLAIIIENAQLRRRAEQLAVVEERNRLARELHDSVTQSLYSTTLFAEAAQRQARAGHIEMALQHLAEVAETSQQALKEMRLLVHKLRPSVLEKEGLLAALRSRLKAVEGRAGIQHELLAEGELQLSRDLEDTSYYILQEALNNALKHSRAANVTVEIRQTDHELWLIARDDGLGFDQTAALAGGGQGLNNIRERVEQLAGTLQICSEIGHGTSVTVMLPAKCPQD